MMIFRLKEIREALDWSQVDLAEKSGLSRSYIAAIESNNQTKSPSMDALNALAVAMNVRVADLFHKPDIPLRGHIGAGAEIDLLNNDDFDEYVEAPLDGNMNSIAVRVTGDSMNPAYEEGEIIYYSANLPAEEMINSKCVVKLGDGRIFIKILRPGTKGFWNLESLNPLYPTMTDQAVEWVARIDWVRPRR